MSMYIPQGQGIYYLLFSIVSPMLKQEFGFQGSFNTLLLNILSTRNTSKNLGHEKAKMQYILGKDKPEELR